MSYYGDIRLGDTIDIQFTTRRFSTGAPFTLAGTPAVAAYVGNGTTEITAGITLSVDHDTRTGLNNVRVVATSGNGYAAATNVSLVITAGTVDSVSVVGEVVGSFSIENRSAVMPTTAGRTLDVSAGGEAGIDWANIGSPTTAQNLSATNIDVDQVVASVSGAVGSVTGAVGSVTGAVGSVTAAVTVGTNNDKTGYSLAADQAVNVTKISGSATAADNLEVGGLGLVVSTCAAGSTTTSIVTNLTEATDDHYNGRVITFTSGALAGQSSSISDYVGATKTLTVVALTEAPANTDQFVIS